MPSPPPSSHLPLPLWVVSLLPPPQQRRRRPQYYQRLLGSPPPQPPLQWELVAVGHLVRRLRWRRLSHLPPEERGWVQQLVPLPLVVRHLEWWPGWGPVGREGSSKNLPMFAGWVCGQMTACLCWCTLCNTASSWCTPDSPCGKRRSIERLSCSQRFGSIRSTAVRWLEQSYAVAVGEGSKIGHRLPGLVHSHGRGGLVRTVVRRHRLWGGLSLEGRPLSTNLHPQTRPRNSGRNWGAFRRPHQYLR